MSNNSNKTHFSDSFPRLLYKFIYIYIYTFTQYKQAWLNEKNAPELLKFPSQALSELNELVEQQVSV